VASGEQVASAGFSYSTDYNDPWLRLQYTATSWNGDQTKVDDRFELAKFSQPFGGHRWYFICPSTGRRAQCMYKTPGAIRFRARRAYRMTYRSQCLAAAWRLQKRSSKFRDRALAAGSPEWRERYGDWEFPPKPPRMRWSTYERLYEEFDSYSGWGEALLMERLLRFADMRR
jgi:hypothetical protein